MYTAEDLALTQRHRLVAQWDRDLRFGSTLDSFIAFPSLTNLEKRATLQGYSVRDLAGYTEYAYVYERNDERELWVRAVDKATRVNQFDYAACWESFARLCGVSEGDLLGSDWQIDHVYPETAAARRSFQLVRVMPVPRRSNAGVGASLEAQLAKFEYGQHKGGWVANWYTIAKITGFNGTFNKRIVSDEELARRLVDHLVSHYRNLETWNQATVADEEKRLTETISIARGRILNVAGRNEGLKEDQLPAWSAGFSAAVHGRANRTPREFAGDARASWRLGWAAGKAGSIDTSE